MDILARLREDFRDAKRSTIEALADQCGVNQGTMRRIVSGRTPNPQYRNVEKIRAWYEMQDAKSRAAITESVRQQAAWRPNSKQMG